MKNLFPYTVKSDTLLITRGDFFVDVLSFVNRRTCQAKFVVGEGHSRSLWCKFATEAFGSTSCQTIINSEQCHGQIQREVFIVFRDWLKDYELKLHVYKSRSARFQYLKLRRHVLFNLRNEVDDKLNDLLETDTIEEVPNTPALWVSPLVVVP